MVDMDGMSTVEIPAVPAVVTQCDLDELEVLRERHEQELRAYEDETRKQRRELRNLKKDLEKRKALEKHIEEIPRLVGEPSLDGDSSSVELERLQDETFRLERAKLEAELQNLRTQRERIIEEALPQRSCAKRPEENLPASSDGDGQSVVPSSASSVVPSVVSSANPSRSNSPSALDACSRSQVLPITSLTVERSFEVPVLAAVPVDSLPNSIETEMLENVDHRPTSGRPGATGKGIGKGKGKATPLPAPAGGVTPRTRQEQNKAKPNKFVNLRWIVSQKPEAVDEDALTNDTFIKKLYEPSTDMQSRSALMEAFPQINVPELPSRIFDPSDFALKEFPEPMLERYFKRNEAAIKLPQAENRTIQKANNFLDQKRLHMVGLMLQKHLMEHREATNRELVLNIKRGVLRCESKMVKLEDLSIIRTVLRHVKPGSALFHHVETHGVDAIWDLEHPEHHYLVYELRKVPQVDERLDCMLFQWEFCENLKKYIDNLKTLTKALDALQAKKDVIQRFFQTAHRLGQSLSQKSSRGFTLSTLEQLTRTKSTKMPHLSILHFVLALMSREDAEELFSNEEIVLLRNAKALGTRKVCDDCRELAQGLYGVKSIYESGEYMSQSGQAVKIERRRKTLPPQAAASAASSTMEPVIDTDDCFHEVMKKFVDSHVDEADDIVVECHKMMLTYKELALFFDDLNNVYPPPKDPNDKKLDLVDVFYHFASEVPLHRQQVEEEGLRDLLGQNCRDRALS
mmetsp:Transcript_106181/g.167664  ORF Transcript_106181/g.167664 Transcript_106181/m.167664 type:complete len:744 (+) Transcript_106181:76-2307(+)